VIDTPDHGMTVSFVNGMWTRNGGVHAEAAFKAIGTGVVNAVNGNKKDKKDKKFKISLTDVKKHISLFISCWLEDPKFDGQTKTALRSPTPKIDIDDQILQPIMNWELISRLYAELEAKQFKAASKTDGKKKKYINIAKGEDANKAGTPESSKCTLYVTEGDSAMGFAVKAVSLIPKGRDFIGIYPMKGKPLNVMNANHKQIAENSEIIDLKNMLGLRERVNYLDEENYKTLRYGHFLIMADSDDDGKHILGLILNLFHCKYPSLLARGYVKYLRTKIIDVRKGKRYKKFYTQNDYEKWRKTVKDYKSWDHSYFKGLGSSEDKDIEEEFKNPKIVSCFYDDLAPTTLSLAFNNKLANERKKWIEYWEPNFKVEKLELQPISDFINHELIQFSISDIARSIPKLMDGLKVSQRKIIWASMKKWGNKAGSDKASKVKVASLVGYIIDQVAYHHGDKSLSMAIINMANDYVGSNNLPYMCKNGQFGTRNKLGKDAADGRYSRTRPQWWWPYIFKKEDTPSLDIIVDEGINIEPKTLLPIIPLQLINGALGIGTGHSTFIPNHDPLDICAWIEAKIKGEDLPPVLPWYRGFQGNIEIITKKKRKEISESSEEKEDTDEAMSDEVAINEETRLTMVTSGKFDTKGNKKIRAIVTELPIGRRMHGYSKWLDKKREEKFISGYNNYSTDEKVHFEVSGIRRPSLRKLRLYRSYGLSNMVLLDSNNRPIKYKDVQEILENFYHIRLGYYVKRKQLIISSLNNRIEILNHKIKFILAVIKGHEIVKKFPNITDEEAVEKECILVMGKSKPNIKIQMEKLNFDTELLKKVTLYQCTEEEVQASRDEIDKLEKERNAKEHTKSEDFWLEDLNLFINAYCKHYKCKYIPNKSLKLNIL